jgi:hypothetical protein
VGVLDIIEFFGSELSRWLEFFKFCLQGGEDYMSRD